MDGLLRAPGPAGTSRWTRCLPSRTARRLLVDGVLVAVAVVVLGSLLPAGPLLWGVVSGAAWLVTSHRLTRRLYRVENRVRALVHSGDAVTALLDADGRVRSLSGPVSDQLGRAVAEFPGRFLVEFLHPHSRTLVAAVVTAVQAGRPVDLPVVVQWCTNSGTWRDIELLGAAPDAEGLVLHLRDVTERSTTQRELERMAYTDFLTGLPNRVRFLTALEQARGSVAAGGRASLVLLDLDGFKSVNDVAGHDAGDHLLRDVAGHLAGAARDSDLVARLGGDEFAIVVHSGLDETLALAERLVALLDRTHRFPTGQIAPDGAPVEGPPLRVSASIGVAEVGPDDDASSAMHRADLALRTAKAHGKNGVQASGEAIVEKAARRGRLARDLPGALDRAELRVVYQPIVGWSQRRVVGVEALIRWEHPELGPIPPEEFVGLAEQDGLIVALQRFVLDEAAAEHVRLIAGGRDLRLGVNVSPLHVQARCLVEDVERVLGRTGLPADRLVIELTESVFTDDVEQLRATLTELSGLGCSIALDDFGSGYSSLTQLAGMPVDVLKMDRGFLTGMDTDPRRAGLVAAVVDLGRALGMDVVAEGVETPEQLAALTGLGCGLLQGWHFARAVPAGIVSQVVDAIDTDLASATVWSPRPGLAG